MAIISISGRIGSGKDTIGSIIQYLVWKAEVESGQDKTLYWTLKDFLEGRPRSDWQIKKFAGKLKQIVSILTGCTVEQLESQEFKASNMSKEWGEMTYREFLQKVGTDALRDKVHKDVWVNALFADYEITGSLYDTKIRFDNTVKENDILTSAHGESTIAKYPNWIITDTRFPNELAAVEKYGGITILVRRNVDTPSTTKAHESETALDNSTFDYVILNNGTIEELVEDVKIILQKEKII